MFRRTLTWRKFSAQPVAIRAEALDRGEQRMRIDAGMPRPVAVDDRRAAPAPATRPPSGELAPRREEAPRRGPLVKGRPASDDLEELARAAATLTASAPSGGPLALHAPSEAPRVSGAAGVAGVVERLLVGATVDGCPEVRLAIGRGPWQGTELRLVAGARGVEATLVVPTEAARRVVEAQLADLARSLEGRGVGLSRCEVATRDEQRRREHDARERRDRWQDRRA
jgi:hypothetical protein